MSRLGAAPQLAAAQRPKDRPRQKSRRRCEAARRKRELKPAFTEQPLSCIIVSLSHQRMTPKKEENIDFLRQLSSQTEGFINEFAPKGSKRFFTWGRTVALAFSFMIVLGLAYSTKAVISTSTIAEQFGNATVFDQIRHLVANDDKPLAGELDGRINVLLLGIGGIGHEGGQLTDTIMLASIDPVTKRMGLLSIPRDLVVPIEGLGWQKINAAHAYGAAWDTETKGAGARLARQTIAAIIGMPIHYYVKLDFAGFEKIINALGGVRIYVPNEFTDYQYPDENYGYEPVHFEQGWHNFDGAAALKYARSRHGTNSEGNDFARARRQQELLRALQARVLALSTLLNPNKLLSLADIVSQHVETDMEIWESIRLLEIGKNISPDNINQMVLSPEEKGLLATDTDENGAYLLRPRAGADNFSEIATLSQHLLDQDPYASFTPPETAPLLRLAVYNGTTYPGLAAYTAGKLRAFAYEIIETNNAIRRDFERTVIYPLNDVAADNIQFIREKLNANVGPELPKFITPPDADVLIIVGKDNIPAGALSLKADN